MVGELTIPATVDGLPVTSIEPRVFGGCEGPAKVTSENTRCTLQLKSLHGVTLKAFLLDPLTLKPMAKPVVYDMV